MLVAAGGQDAELYLALFSYQTRSSDPWRTDFASIAEDRYSRNIPSEQLWEYHVTLSGSINNSSILYWPPQPPSSNENGQPSTENCTRNPRLVISNNDHTVKFYDISLSNAQKLRSSPRNVTMPSGERSQDRRRDQNDADQTNTSSSAQTTDGDAMDPENDSFGGQLLVLAGTLQLDVPVNHSKSTRSLYSQGAV